jgi:hypothetical protein
LSNTKYISHLCATYCGHICPWSILSMSKEKKRLALSLSLIVLIELMKLRLFPADLYYQHTSQTVSTSVPSARDEASHAHCPGRTKEKVPRTLHCLTSPEIYSSTPCLATRRQSFDLPVTFDRGQVNQTIQFRSIKPFYLCLRRSESTSPRVTALGADSQACKQCTQHFCRY